MRNIPFSPPDITELEIQEVCEALRSGWITTGPRTKQLEKELAEYCHVAKLVCLNSATLCSRYEIDNSKRTLHGALLDSQILADVYLMMTGGQTSIKFSMEGESQNQSGEAGIQRVVRQANKLRVVLASDEELMAHESRLDLVQKKGGSCLWRG